tara:strand:- start:578 stop:5479 length:4902 start_codon:yes stop_codon:yes gene_type:complete
MARYTKVLKSLAHNAVGSKRIEAVSTSGSSISSLTYVPGSYHYVATQSNGTNITGNSQNLFGNQIKLSGSSAGGVQLYEATSNGSNYLQLNAPAAITTNFVLTLPNGPPSTSGYALVSTDAGVMSWSAFSGGNTYITGLAYAPSTQKITATLSDSSTVVQSPSLEEFGDSISIKGTNEGHVDLYEKAVNGSAYVSLRAPVDMGTNPSYIISLPVADGTTGQVMARGSGGQLTWVNNDDANYYVTGGTYDSSNDEIDFSGTTGFPAFSVDTSDFAKGSIAGASTYVPYFTAASALTGTNTFRWDNANGFLTLSNATASTVTHTGHPLLVLENTNADAFPAGIKLYKNSASSAANDLIGLIRFYANDNAGTPAEEEYARIEGEVESSTAGAEIGKLSFYTVNNGTRARRLWMSGATTTINSNTEITGTLSTTGVATLGNNSVTNTQSAGNDSTRIATTAFVSTAVDNAVASSSQYYNTFYNSSQGLVGSARLQTDASNNIILSGASNIAKTAADFQSTLGVSGALTVSGNSSLKGTLGVASTTTLSGATTIEAATDIIGNLTIKDGGYATPMWKMTATQGAGKVAMIDSGSNVSTPQFFPILQLHNEAQDVDPGGGGAVVYADMPTIHFRKLGPRNAVNSANTTAGFRFLASGLSTAAATTTQKQFLVYTYQPDESTGTPSEIAKLDSTGIFTATTFAGELDGTISSTTTATTQSASNNSTKVATTAYVDAAVSAGGGGTIGGSIADNQVAFGATTADSIEGSDNFTYDGTDLSLTSATSNKPVFTLENTNSDDAPAFLDFKKNVADGQQAASDTLGQIRFYGKDSANNLDSFVDMYVQSPTITSTSENGALFMRTRAAGTMTQTLTLNAGNVGIGTTAPARKLHVYSGSNGYAARFEDGIELDGTNVQLLGYGQGNLWLMGNSGNPKLTLGYSHNWDFAVSLRYLRGATTGSSYVGDGEFRLGQTDKNNANYDHGITSFYVSGSEAMRLNKAGYLGIGTTNPLAPLHVYKADGWSTGQNWMQWIQNAEATDDSNYGLRISAGSTGNDTAFFVQDHDASNDYFVIRGDGDVGIGTTSPARKLEVNYGSSSGYMRIVGQSKSLLLGQDSVGAAIYQEDNAPMYFATNNAERMRILADGKVGIGTTGPDGKLEIIGSNGTVSQTPESDAEELVIRNNHRAGISILSSESSGRGGYIVFGGATDSNAANIHHDFDSKEFSFQGQNPSMELRFASANNVEAMRIDTSQNVGIGTDSPAYKLDVVGTTQLSGNTVITGTLATTGVATLGNNSVTNTQSAGDNSTKIATTEFVTAALAAGGYGNVTKVGTPANNQIGVWTGDGTIEGDTNFTYDGTDLTIGNSGKLKVVNASSNYWAIYNQSNGKMRIDQGTTQRVLASSGEFQFANDIIIDNDLIINTSSQLASGRATVLDTANPQLTLAYDGSNYVTHQYTSAGNYKIITAGGNRYIDIESNYLNIGTGQDVDIRLQFNANTSVGYQYWMEDEGRFDFLSGSTSMASLDTTGLTVTGTVSATAKSFNIAHPLYKDKRLVHGSLEGPEHGIYIRGTIEAIEGCEIELPEYWSAMCEDYTVQLTPHGPYTVFIREKQKDKVMVGCSSKNYKFDYYIVGSRTDETLEVVQDA